MTYQALLLEKSDAYCYFPTPESSSTRYKLAYSQLGMTVTFGRGLLISHCLFSMTVEIPRYMYYPAWHVAFPILLRDFRSHSPSINI